MTSRKAGQAPEIAVAFDRVNIVFGDHPERALPLMDRGLSRTDRADQNLMTRQVLLFRLWNPPIS